MGLKILFQPPAKADLQEISRYIARDNPTRARSFRQELKDRTKRLADFPELGRRLPDTEDPSVREIIHGNCRIIYRVDRAEGTIRVLRFWHAARGEPRLFIFEP